MNISVTKHFAFIQRQVKLKGLKIKEFIDPTGIKQYLTKPSKDHHINLKSSVREEKIGRVI